MQYDLDQRCWHDPASGCLYKIVHGLALTRISPNALTFIGLVINIVAGVLFGFANAETSAGCSSMPGW